MKTNNKILIADDEELVRITLQDILNKEGYEVTVAEDGEKGWDTFQHEKFILVLCDIKMPGISGIELLKKIKQSSPDTLVIMLTAYGTISSAVQCMKMGAYDYLTKPFIPEDMLLLIKKSIEFYSLKEENKFLKERLKGKCKIEGFIGQNEKMQKIHQLIEAISKVSATVLIQGETGTGKELVAEAIHNLSARKNNPLIKVSCAGLPETLLESELFGHEKGAFTDAISKKIGRFEMADRGTLFLDDVDDINMVFQVKLLRALQERRFERVGGMKSIEVDIRVVAATKKDLWEMVRQNKFRDDLYYRLNVITINIPPLRERKDDIPLLVDYFIDRYGKKYNKKRRLPEEAISQLFYYDWPGNIRELENLIEKLVVLSNKQEISADDVMRSLKKETADTGCPGKRQLTSVLKETEREQIINVLTQTHGKKEEAAKILGISRKTLWQKIREHNI